MPLRSSSPPSSPTVVSADAPRILLVDEARFDAHASGAYHPERPERLTAARSAVARAQAHWDRVPAREATNDELVRVHSPAFVEQLEKLRGARGYLDPDTYVAPASIQAARLAAGGLVALVDRMLDESKGAPEQAGQAGQTGQAGQAGQAKTGVALLRPPGHHARPAQAMGFCLVNNIAVAAAHAVSRGLERVLVVDWDVHHGNGTQEMFWREPKILYMSLHQYPFYPGTGTLTEIGEGAGEGFTVNVPLTAHGGDGVYRSAFEQVLLPIAEAYAPELVLVSAGFDAAVRDPLAQMEVTADAFGWMSRALAEVARKSASGRMALVLEGGYDLVSLESGLGQAIEGMSRPSFARDRVAREPDHPDVARAREGAARTWAKVL
jgi:acetoin utilization deacetylase AcuC-like enzyme